MTRDPVLASIRNNLFYGSSNYTKNQPDLFVPHNFQMVAPSQVGTFVESLRESIWENEILLYVHLPFCFSECLFCNSFPHKADRHIQQEYLLHLIKEIELISDYGVFDGKKAKCIYFGGGTPTSFSNDDIKRIIEKIASCIELSENCNITSEAHPATLENKDRVAELAKIGLKRISVGCQTFDPEILAFCNRFNTASQVKRIVQTVQDAGLTINLDMMTGLPGQTMASVKNDLEILEKLQPNAIEYIRHEIVNPLVVNLYRDRPNLIVDDDLLFEMVLLTQDWMEKSGYEQNGRYSNGNQWEYRYHWLKELPIIAFGSRTRSYTKTICYDKHEDLATYSRLISKGIPPIGRYIPLTKKERMYRSVILRLQLRTGINVKEFHDTYNEYPADVFSLLFSQLKEYGCLEQDSFSIKLTNYGAYFVEDICDFIIDSALREESENLVRAPHSEGSKSSRLKP